MEFLRQQLVVELVFDRSVASRPFAREDEFSFDEGSEDFPQGGLSFDQPIQLVQKGRVRNRDPEVSLDVEDDVVRDGSPQRIEPGVISLLASVLYPVLNDAQNERL